MKKNNEADKDIILRILRLVFKGNTLKLIFVFCLVIYSTLTNVFLSLFIRNLIDNNILPLLKNGSTDFAPLNALIFKMAIVFALGVLSTLIYTRLMVDISEESINKLRIRMFDRMEDLPVSYFDRKSHGDVMSYYTNDVQNLGQAIANSIPAALSSIMTIGSCIVAMIIQSFLLSLIIFLTMGLMTLVIKKIGKISSGYFLNQQKSLGITNGFVEEMVNGMKVVKIFSHEEKSLEDFSKINDELAKNTMMANRLSLSLMPIIFGIGNFQYILFAFFGALLAINNIGGISVGLVASFLQLSRSVTGPMSQVATQVNQVVLAMAGAERIFEFLKEDPEKDKGTVDLVRIIKEEGKFIESQNNQGILAWKDVEAENIYIPLRGDIEFKNVNFSYDGKNLVLKNINLFARPGQKIAFVGATGAGKTTITNLINRFYEIDSGLISYDGIDIRRIKKSALRKTLGMILQDTHLFTGTVYDNIKFGNPEASEEIVKGAAQRVMANKFIENLENSYQTEISGTELELSQGQAQLLSIARAEVYNPPVMILDEATSSIDTRTEKIVQRGMDKLMKGRTTFVIAHRISTIMDSDVILVLDRGEIVERGDHNELLEKKGIYASLYLGDFEEEA
ncbi:ABC transporter ATP-binding protein [Peptoniphilus raoultii]|uniref:ABC transporter ATP-binding protein n=1 Tax=Peptoniphilus raoultii TaxID=1776387 RepID=UPI0008DA9893|nr:ABC transporter ATP-binding protein [Peptoniphilus raoultii]